MKTIRNFINGELSEYKVTYKPMVNKEIHLLPQQVQDQIAELFVSSQQEPSEAILLLQPLINQYSHIPQLYNFITTAYSLLDDYETAERYALESCRIHPNYLFAKINCAEICLRKDEYYKVPIIFDHKMYLQLLYPERDEFHLTEAVGFNGVCGIYYGKIGDRLMATPYYQTVKQLSPESPMAQRIKTLLD